MSSLRSRLILSINVYIPYIRRNKLMIIIVLLGCIAHLLTALPYAREYCLRNMCGLWFSSSINARDELWQLAVASSTFATFPLRMPNFSGEAMHGYHILYSLLLHIFSLRNTISLTFLSGTVFPILWVVLYAYLSVRLSRRLSSSSVFIHTFLFLQFFAGSFGYILSLYHTGSILGSEGMNYQPILYLTNKPLALSMLLFLTVLLIILKREVTMKIVSVLVLILFLQWGAKFHAGAATLLLLGLWILTSFIHKKISLKKGIIMSSVFICVSSLSIVLFYNPTNGNSGGSPIRFSPFALAHSIIEEPYLLYMKDMVNARYTLYASGKFGPRLIGIELFSSVLYLFFLMGTRFIAFLQLAKIVINKKLATSDVWFLGVIIGTCFLMLFFVQNGDWFNTMQFFSYGLVLLNIYTAMSLETILHHLVRYLRKPFITVFVLLTIPYSLSVVIASLLPFTSIQVRQASVPLYISTMELSALRKLAQMKDGVVFHFPTTQSIIHSSNNGSSQKLWTSEDTTYITALSGKQSYFTYINQLYMLGVRYKTREKEVNDMSNLQLVSLPVDYYYLVKAHPYYSKVHDQVSTGGFVRVMENDEVLVLKKR
jgi:hypothetical protein